MALHTDSDTLYLSVYDTVEWVASESDNYEEVLSGTISCNRCP